MTEQDDRRLDRELLGRIVRETWVRWARKQPNPKPSWLVQWDGLDESDKEVDRQIGEAVADHVLHPISTFKINLPSNDVPADQWMRDLVKRISDRAFAETMERFNPLTEANAREARAWMDARMTDMFRDAAKGGSDVS